MKRRTERTWGYRLGVASAWLAMSLIYAAAFLGGWYALVKLVHIGESLGW